VLISRLVKGSHGRDPTVRSHPRYFRPARCASRIKAKHPDQDQSDNFASDNFALSFAHK
jgi:hypothetical protein